MELTKMTDLFNQDLSGWQITQCHLLELKHGLMGFFPAIRTDNEKMIVVWDKRMLKRIWDHLDPRRAKVTSFFALVNLTDLSVGFEIKVQQNHDYSKPFHILNNEELELLCAKEDSFAWAPGLLDLSGGPVDPPDFS